MPNNSPAITPEGRRAAERVRTIFFLIAAANIVFVALIFWYRQIEVAQADSARREAVFTRALAAYNAQDRDGFLACFSTNAEPRADAAFFSAIIVGEYHRDFGKVTASKLKSAATSTDNEGGMRNYDITCEKRPRARLTTRFSVENGSARLIQWRMVR